MARSAGEHGHPSSHPRWQDNEEMASTTSAEKVVTHAEIFWHSPTPMLILLPNSPVFTIVDVNKAYLEATLTDLSIVGKPMFEVFPENPSTEASGPAKLRESFERVLATKTADYMALQHFDIPIQNGEFIEKHWSPMNTPILSPDHKVKGIILRVTDVTEMINSQREQQLDLDISESLSDRTLVLNEALKRKNRALAEAIDYQSILNERLQESTRKAEFALKAKSDFLANVSHEMRTPLNAVIGFSELLQREKDLTPSSKEFVHSIHIAGQHLIGIINDLLDLVKLGANKLKFEVQPVDLPTFLSEISAIMKPLASQKGLSFTMSVPPDLPKLIKTDPLRLRQILMNLFSNSLKFTFKGEISLKVSSLSSQNEEEAILSFSVTDTGIGISSEDLPKLFQRFEQASNTRVAVTGGTGLGLAITKEMVRLLGGEINVESELGQGSTFTVFLTFPISPTGPNENPREEEAKWSLVLREHSRTNILIVDDIEMNRKVIVALLTEFGFENIDQASDGDEALEMAKKKHYTIFFMDIYMPKMNGIDAAKALRAIPEYENAYLIAVSASTLSERCSDEIDEIFLIKLTKPLTMGSLFDALVSCGIRFRSLVRPRLKVLIVDDQAFSRRLISHAFTENGDHSQECWSGQSALAILKEQHFDVILVDRVMPAMDGIQAVEAMRKEQVKAPIFIMSASLTDEDRLRAVEAGANGCLLKPVKMDEFNALWSARERQCLTMVEGDPTP